VHYHEAKRDKKSGVACSHRVEVNSIAHPNVNTATVFTKGNIDNAEFFFIVVIVVNSCGSVANRREALAIVMLTTRCCSQMTIHVPEQEGVAQIRDE